MWPMVQSMPELIHHLPKVVDLLESELLKSPLVSLPSFLQLVSVLARYLRTLSIFHHT
jgi:hypothetical protein